MALIDNLISYWKLDEASGNAADSVGSNTLTNNNSATYSAGKINNGVNLVLASSQSLSIADASQTGLDLVGDFTFSFWVKFTSLPANTYTQGLVNKDDASNHSFNTYLYNVSGTYYIAVAINSTYKVTSITWAGAATGTWFYFTIRYTASTGVITCYVNDSSIGTATGLPTSIDNTAAAFKLGDDGYNPGSTINGHLNGSMDEVGVWSRVLTSGEVTSLYNSGAGFQYPFSADGPANLKTYNTNAKANIKSINTNLIANVKTLNTNA